MFTKHGISDPLQILFFWTLFEGIPKFYRDCYEQNVFGPDPDYREKVLRHIFFEGSSPLRSEAENWFLRELHGRYDVALKLVAQHPGASHATLVQMHRRLDSTSEEKQFGGYLQTLIEKFRMIEKRQPIFAPAKGRKGRYYLTDNFLQAWLGALDRQVRASKVKPAYQVIPEASRSLESIEGFAFEKFTSQLIEQLSRKGRGIIALSDVLRGYWDRPDPARDNHIEIDFVGISKDDREILFGSCKRSASKHDESARRQFIRNTDAFLQTHRGREYADWRVRRALFSPSMSADEKTVFQDDGFETHTINDLWDRLD
jgi:hypothetical protein